MRFALAASLLLIAAAPAPNAVRPSVFPAAVTTKLANGAVIVSQSSADTPLANAQVFLPAGSGQQSFAKAGIAGVTAALVLASPVERGTSLSQVARELGAALSYTIDPQDTRFSFECKASDLPRLLADFATALRSPDPANLGPVRHAALQAATDAIADPATTAFGMIRESTFSGTAYARLDQGTPASLQAITPADVAAFAGQYRHGPGTAVALSGNITPDVVSAATAAFGDFAAAPAERVATPAPSARTRELVAHRDVSAPWVAIGYVAPSQYSTDFAAMLVIETLLGRGADPETFAVGSDAALPEDFVGGYYQFEAQPGLFIEFFNGANIDKDLHDLDDGIVRLRGTLLPSDLLAQAKYAALGDYLTSVASLDDQSWLLGRSVLSPQGAAFENVLAARIASVTPADVQRVARRYLSSQTIAVVLPNGGGQ